MSDTFKNEGTQDAMRSGIGPELQVVAAVASLNAFSAISNIAPNNPYMSFIRTGDYDAHTC
ncbi:hypothetical protein GCM10007094_04730 [Pseudovibrio japonicus]|uniref:Uncharacterized protein n=1 Tax=Pseudovibrio japonicus TaxID=366534 RepID=A0ABQ3E0Q2_9HYPH|nr:hypothetical protein GCM10007094_04730 [Pseudovibrio japonicus]